MEVKENMECKRRISKAGALLLSRRSGTLRRAQDIVNKTSENDYYPSSSSNIIPKDEGRYICIPVRKNIKYAVYNSETKKTEFFIKKSSEFVPFGMKSGEASYKRLSWSENPANRYDISQSINSRTNKEEDKGYTLLDLKEGVSDSLYVSIHQVTDYIAYGAGNPGSPAEIPYENTELTNNIELYAGADLAYIPGIIKIKAGNGQEAGTVEFEINEFTFDGTFGFDRYDDRVQAFKNEYEKLPDREYRVSNMSLWLNEGKTVKAKIKKNPQSTGGSVYYQFKKENNGITVSSSLLNADNELVMDNKDFEFDITIEGKVEGKDALLVLDKSGKTVGKLNIYSKDKGKIARTINYKVVDVTFGNTPSNTTSVAVNLNNYSEKSNIENHLNQNSYNQAFTQLKNINIILEYLTIPQSEIDKLNIIANSSLQLNSSNRNLQNIRELLRTKYGISNKSSERIIFLINNRETDDNVSGFASPEFNLIVIFKPSLTNWETFVHELGHTLGLDHPFEMNSQYKKSSTTNFMDYSLKTNLFWHWQWKIINNTDFK